MLAQVGPTQQVPTQQIQEQEVLRWRHSTNVPQPHHVPTDDVFFDDNQVRSGMPPATVRRANVPNQLRDARTADYNRPAQAEVTAGEVQPPSVNQFRQQQAQQQTRSQVANGQQDSQQPIQQVGWNDPGGHGNTAVPQAVQVGSNFFSNPFGEAVTQPQSAARSRATTSPRQLAPPRRRLSPPQGRSASMLLQTESPFSLPPAGNSLRSQPPAAAPPSTLPAPNTPPNTLPAPNKLPAPPQPGATDRSNMFDALLDQEPPFDDKQNPFADDPPTPGMGPSGSPGVEIKESEPIEIVPEPSATPKAPDADSLRDLLDRERLQESMEELSDPDLLDEDEDTEKRASPSDRKDLFEDPFRGRGAQRNDEEDKKRLQDRMDRQKSESGDDDTDDKADDDAPSSLDDMPKENGGVSSESCEDFRQRLSRENIRSLSLDISPPFRPDIFDESEYQEMKSKFNAGQTVRPWTTIQGTMIANGRLVDLAYEKAVIENGLGAKQEISIHELSEGDLAYISKNWGLPQECLLPQVAYTPRNWQTTVVTWKASNLCHKPLYFQEVNLERYGHTAGPILQPVVSSAHFFANIAVIPYKMGVHSPKECQYALGYYRPGNCAPWIVPPVPISARGAVAQAAVVTAGFWLIP